MSSTEPQEGSAAQRTPEPSAPETRAADRSTADQSASDRSTAEPRTPREPERPASSLPFVPILIAFLLAATGLHAWILAQAWAENPLVNSLQADAKTYWTWAERIAGGQWVGTEPFHVPPLYAYALALLQLAGGGWLAVYVVQLALHVASMAFVAAIGRRLAGPAVGLVAAALFACFEDSAFFVQRISPPSLQVFLIAWTWWEWLGCAERPSVARAVRAGVALGLSVLANPVMLPAAVLLVLWLAWRARGGALAWSRVVLVAVATGAAIVPAPLHNWAAARELIAVSTQGGLAFAIGNQPGALGTYHELEGVSVLRDRQDSDALALARAKTGDANLGWNGADRYFYGRGLDFWFGEPAAAASLLWKKVRWFVTGPSITDSYVPALEIESGFASRLRAAWLKPAWVLLLAFGGAWCVRRAGVASLPGLVVLLLPFAAVVVYHYSARYRVPALPAVAVVGAAALVEIVRGSDHARRVVLAALLGLGVASTWINAKTDFDPTELYRIDYERMVGAAYVNRGDTARAEEHLRRASELGDSGALSLRAETLRSAGKLAEAKQLAEQALAEDADDPYAARILARISVDSGDYAKAAELFERALAREPSDVESELALGSCYVALGNPAKGLLHYERGLALSPGSEDLVYLRGLALEALGRADEAAAAWTPLADAAHLPGPGGQPSQARFAARGKLIELLIQQTRYGAAIERLRGALMANSSDAAAAISLAKLLASSPNDAERDGATALQIAQALRSVAPDAPEVLEVWSLALAEGGNFDEAAQASATAAERARASGAADFAAELDRRAALFRAKTPFRLPRAR
ncbi:MAG: tetratricopeptide repeat protein [Planctomycetes bacterium]|nr:tetratricopeptide repeat protein [Planctomycetota bacterium]